MTTLDRLGAGTGTYTRTLAEFASSIDPDALPHRVVAESRRVLVDCVGVGVAGLITDAGRIAVETARDEHGPLEARVIGAGRATVGQAAMANEILVNAIDYEVYGPEGHVCAVAVPAALAMADALGASGKELLAGLVAGIEIGGRIGGAIRRPGQSGVRDVPPVRGHAHACFSAAAAAGRLLQLDASAMVNALGIAGYSATLPTLRKFFDSPHSPMTKYDHLGLVTQSGIAAAVMAKKGFTGDPEVLEGSVPFWKLASTNGCDWDFLTADLGTRWTMDEVLYKPYPVALPMNPVLDVVRQIVRDNNLDPRSIGRIEVRTERQMSQPLRPVLRNSLDAWQDRPFNVAVAAFDIHPWRAWQLPSCYENEDILSLARKVEFAAMREGELGAPGNYWEGWAPVRVSIDANEHTYSGQSDFLRVPTDRELSDKFVDNVGGLMDDRSARELEQRCWDFVNLETTRDLCDLLPGTLPVQ